MPTQPLAFDLCCGSGGWTDELLTLGYQVIGVDIRKHPNYKSHFVHADVRELPDDFCQGAQLIVASPPCTEFSIAKKANRESRHQPDLSIVDACRKLAARAQAPLVLENVHYAQRWLGPAAHHYGHWYLWGDGVPALLPAGPRWKDREKMMHRDPIARARIPANLARAIGAFHLITH